MDSKEILQQYIVGAMKSKSAIAELEKNLVDTSTLLKMQEAARSRYVIGFIRRVIQFKCDEASAKDLCLNIRDIILFLGRVKLTEKIYNVVREYGAEFDLVCENDLQVSCLHHIPEWLEPHQYIKDVYALRLDDSIELECESSRDAILAKHTGFNTYKNFEQKVAVHTALNLPNGHTLLISLPTGGGKSLVTQLLASTSEGITVVIVPTVALALDQYHAARHNLTDKTEIYCYRGEQSEVERTAIIKALKGKKARILFTSPEAILKNPELHRILDDAAKSHYLANVVVDEAHVVPDWGVFFRPDFQIFSILLKKWKRESGEFIRTFLLSATLSDDVVDTLFALFGSDGKNAQVRCDALRQEPRFYFHSAKSRKEQDDKTIEAIRLLPKPMVVYVLEPREAKDLQKKLRQVGYKNIPIFTGETKEADRDAVLTGWKNHDFDVVIATSAFGIGVDKPDVRTIIHACCPENLSRFYQEVGRGGRDRLPSLSLFIPYQSRYDSEGDMRRALGLVNKRVLTVERAVIRWKGMLSNPTAIIDADECVLNTSATPATMTDEEAEYAGNRNVAWNVNLLLFLHRTGFIDLLDTNYVFDKKSNPPKKYYTVTIKLLHPDILSDDDSLTAALKEPRAREYEAQMLGYRIMAELVSSPKALCWGRVFRHLFPLSREVCNGCPADPEGRITSDETYKLRTNPDIQLPPARPSRRLDRNMGSFNEMIISRPSNGPCSAEEVAVIAEKASQNNIGALVVPNRLANQIVYDGILLNYEEFYYAVAHCPYFFAKGVVCIFDGDTGTNFTLYKNLGKLDAYGYRRILYCNENTIVANGGKTIREYSDGYPIPIQKF
ncbi:MAG: DEAD/DEAH box helicase [Faecousia sp.]